MTTAAFQYDVQLDEKSLTELPDGSIKIAGYASSFNVDRENDFMDVGAFSKGLDKFIQAPNGGAMLFNHKYDVPVGRWTLARVDRKGLYVEGLVYSAVAGSKAAEVYNKIKQGVIRSMSVGGIFHRQKSELGGPTKIGRVDLLEISVCPVGVNADASFEVIATKAFADPDADLQADLLRLRSEIAELASWKSAQAATAASRVDDLSDYVDSVVARIDARQRAQKRTAASSAAARAVAGAASAELASIQYAEHKKGRR